jgi:hypothetical protein
LFGDTSTSSAATWLIAKTIAISPQCSVPAARRKPSVSPISTIRIGRKRKA